MTETPENENEYRAQRQANLDKLAELGYVPYGHAFPRTGRLAEIRADFELDREVKVAGRIVAKRDMGKSVFLVLYDGTDRFQVFVNQKQIGEEAFEGIKVLDIADHVGVEGSLFETKTGEQTVKAKQWTLLSKALLPLPDKWGGLTDTDARYRQRYLDLISHDEVRRVFDLRIKMIWEMRKFLVDRGYFEVETPMMQAEAGGAAATPFETFYNALDCPMFLRIAPELYLKRLLVGGFDKVFELNRNFRNEGLSRSHNPEFTMLEIYEAYGNMESMKELVQSLICHLAETVMGTLQVGTESEPIDLTEWTTVEYHSLIRQKAGEDFFDLSLDGMKARATELGCHVDPAWNEIEVGQEIFEKLIEKTLINPTFVTRLPAQLIPLAKPCEDDASLVDVFELIIGGREIAPGYNELNDPDVQRKALLDQAGDETTAVDDDFIVALEHGMPPAGGMGVGIDRLVMLLTGSEAIRDVILFPQLKPKV